MPPTREDLTAGEWAVLALLVEAPAHGFALSQAMAPDGDVGRVWAVRRPLVYRAVDTLTRLGHVRPAGTVASPSGPRRTVLEPTPAGRRALEDWLREPVEHVRDGRSLLLLKLLFLQRRGLDAAELLEAQRVRFAAIAERLAPPAAAAEGFDRALLLWRLESTTAALRFVEALAAGPAAPARRGVSRRPPGSRRTP